jgi:hypothetical protein
MRFFLAICTMAATLVAHEAQAMRDPKWRRFDQLWTALEHLREVAQTLKDPIDKIEYGDSGEVRVWARKCFVPVVVVGSYSQEYDKSGKPTIPAPGDEPSYKATVGKMQCP